jgi:hypothetical protein
MLVLALFAALLELAPVHDWPPELVAHLVCDAGMRALRFLNTILIPDSACRHGLDDARNQTVEAALGLPVLHKHHYHPRHDTLDALLLDMDRDRTSLGVLQALLVRFLESMRGVKQFARLAQRWQVALTSPTQGPGKTIVCLLTLGYALPSPFLFGAFNTIPRCGDDPLKAWMGLDAIGPVGLGWLGSATHGDTGIANAAHEAEWANGAIPMHHLCFLAMHQLEYVTGGHRRLDMHVHGSRSFGLACAESDLDVSFLGRGAAPHQSDFLRWLFAALCEASTLGSLRWEWDGQLMSTNGGSGPLRIVLHMYCCLPHEECERCLHIDVLCRDAGFDQTLTHMVLAVPSLLLAWMKPLVLLLKQLLSRANLDDTYLGGLSSQSLTRMAMAFLQAWPSSTRTLEGLLLGFCEHYSSGTHPEMIVSLGQIGKVRSQFTLAGCTLRTKGLVAMLALSASASSSRLE